MLREPRPKKPHAKTLSTVNYITDEQCEEDEAADHREGDEVYCRHPVRHSTVVNRSSLVRCGGGGGIQVNLGCVGMKALRTSE